MTHDKVRQDFERDMQPPSCWEELSSWNEAYSDYCKGYQAGRAAERAEIREKLESEGVVVAARELYQNSANGNARVIPFEQSCEERLRWMFQAKAAITRILEVI